MCFKHMGLIQENLRGRRGPLSSDVIKRIEMEKARAAEVRAMRQGSPESLARREAVSIFPHIRKLGMAMSNPDNLAERILAEHILSASPLSFVGFWGIGKKQEVDSYDIGYVEELRKIRSHIEDKYPHGVKLELLLADAHGVFNGYVSPVDLKSAYLDQVEGLLERAGFQSRRLSDLYGRHRLELPDSTAPVDDKSDAYRVYAQHRDQYLRASRRHYGNEVVEGEQGAYWYVAMRLGERPMLESEFPSSFLFVNGTKMAAEPLMPKGMPVIYLPQGPVWFKEANV